MIIDEMTTTDKIEYYKKLLELERRTLASVTEQRNKLKRELTETCKRYEIACETAAKMHAAAVGEIKGPHIDPVQDVANVRRERDEYRGLLIELYNDLNIIHSGNAVRKLSKMFRDENYN
jgi:hypothetical protein